MPYFCKYHPKVQLIVEPYGHVCPECGVVNDIPNYYEGGQLKRNSKSDDEGNDVAENLFLSEAYGQAYMQSTTDPKHLDEKGKLKYRCATKRSAEDRRIVNAQRELRLICDRLELNQMVFTHAMAKFVKYFKSKDAPNSVKSKMYYACVYLVCKELKISRTLAEVVEFSTVTLKEISTTIKNILEALSEKIEESEANQYISRYITHLNISDKKIMKLAFEIIRKLREMNMLTKELPHVLAASAVLWASALRKGSTKPKEVETATGVSVSILRITLKTFNSNSLAILEGSESLLT